MNKIVKILLSGVMVSLMTINVFADTKITEKLPKVLLDEVDYYEHTTDTYSIVINGEDTGKTINVREYDARVGDFVSLREFVEVLGGSITWEPNEETKYLGKFEFLNKEYKYYSHYPFDDTKDMENAFALDLFMIMEDKDVNILMNGMVESVYTKCVDGKIYIRIKSLRRLLPRMGYLFNLDKENLCFNIKAYDFESEKKLVNEKFPVDKFGNGLYGRNYNGIVLDGKTYWLSDLFCEQSSQNESLEQKYFDYINNDFTVGYIIKEEDKNTFYRGVFEALTLTKFDDVYIDYDEELDAYIIYNKNFYDVESLDKTYKILAIRKFDNMVLYSKAY